MLRPPPISTLSDTLFPDTRLIRSETRIVMTQLRQARGHSRHHLRISDLPPIAVSVRKSWVVCEFASEKRTDECAHGTKVTFIACLDRFACLRREGIRYGHRGSFHKARRSEEHTSELQSLMR